MSIALEDNANVRVQCKAILKGERFVKNVKLHLSEFNIHSVLWNQEKMSQCLKLFSQKLDIFSLNLDFFILKKNWRVPSHLTSVTIALHKRFRMWIMQSSFCPLNSCGSLIWICTLFGKDDNDVIYINVKLSMLLLGNGPPAGLLV